MEDIKKHAIDIEGHSVVNVNDINDVCPAFFIGCRNLHQCVKRHSIPATDYFLRKQENGKLVICKAKSKNKITYIKISFLESKLVFVPVAPPLLTLEDDELLRDFEDNPCQVEVRGERHYLKSFFLASDIGKAFGSINFSNNLSGKERTFHEGEDYIKMIVPERKTTEVFLTYTGLMRAIYTTRSETARKYVLWTAKIVHAHHMGAQEQKEKLAAKMIGIPTDILKQFSGKIYIGGMPGVYIFMIGTVKELRNKFGLSTELPEDYIVLKFGRTISMERRTKEHIRGFKTPTKRRRSSSGTSTSTDSTVLTGNDSESEHFADVTEITELTDDPSISIVHYAHIDPRNIVAAETIIKKALEGRLIQFQNRREIIAIPRSDLPLIENLFIRVKQECSGGIEELEAQVKDETNKRVRFEEKCEMYEEKCEMYEKQCDIYKSTLDEQKKQNEFIQKLVMSTLRKN